MAMDGTFQNIPRRCGSPKRVKSDAYLYASEGHRSREIEKLQMIDRFGLEAVTGHRVLLFRDYQRMMTAQNIVAAYGSRAKSQNWAAWVVDNPKAAELLAEAMKLCP